MEPLVSIVMPVYNGERFLHKALCSVIDQTFIDWELIAIDDCSQDSSLGILKKFKDARIRIYKNEFNEGIANTRNRAIDLAKGKYIAIMDQDDISLPERLKAQTEFLEEHEEIGALSGCNDIIDENGDIIKSVTQVLKNPRYIKAKLLFENVFYNGTAMFRKEILNKYNIKYRNNQFGMEDFRFWVECSKHMDLTAIEIPVYQHRIHENNETKRFKSEKLGERKKCYSDIQKFSLEKSGFILEEYEYEVISLILAEDGINCENKDNLEKLIEVFKKIVIQARDMGMDNLEEIDILCKQKTGAAIRNCKDFFIKDFKKET